MSLVPPSSGPDVDWARFAATLLLSAGTLSLLLLASRSAPQHTMARVAYQIADRRREAALLGGVLLMGLVVGYLAALLAG